MWTEAGKTTLVGLTSYSDIKNKEEAIITLCIDPVLYTRVSYYMDWIKHHIGDDYCTV